MNRKCSGKCQKTLPMSEYHRSHLGRDGYQARCITCSKAAKKTERECELNVKMVNHFLRYGFLS